MLFDDQYSLPATLCYFNLFDMHRQWTNHKYDDYYNSLCFLFWRKQLNFDILKKVEYLSLVLLFKMESSTSFEK
jgi:hypothetical protein